VCRKDENPNKLLCCDLCPGVYHTYCLDPPLARVPTGDWFCKACAHKLGLQDMEKVLAERWVDKEGAGGGWDSCVGRGAVL
jgi:hypothetical protein